MTARRVRAGGIKRDARFGGAAVRVVEDADDAPWIGGGARMAAGWWTWGALRSELRRFRARRWHRAGYPRTACSTYAAVPANCLRHCLTALTSAARVPRRTYRSGHP